MTMRARDIWESMRDDVSIGPFTPPRKEQVFSLILPIVCDEFGIFSSPAAAREYQPDLEQIADFYQQGAGNFWIALDDGEVVGTIAFKDIGNRQLALRKMFVHADYRGKEKGIAQRLLDGALLWAKNRRIADIFLGTTAQFLAAHRFYEKNGFEEIKKEDLPPDFPLMRVDTRFYCYRPG